MYSCLLESSPSLHNLFRRLIQSISPFFAKPVRHWRLLEPAETCAKRALRRALAPALAPARGRALVRARGRPRGRPRATKEEAVVSRQ